jgi:hypothetical protein
LTECTHIHYSILSDDKELAKELVDGGAIVNLTVPQKVIQNIQGQLKSIYWLQPRLEKVCMVVLGNFVPSSKES